MKKNPLSPLLLLLLLVPALFGCGEDVSQRDSLKRWFAPSGRIKVLCTTSIVCDLVSYIGGDAIDPLVLIRGELDPHSYQLVKGDDEKLAAADLIFSNGLGLEHGSSLQHYLQENEKHVPLGDLILKEHPERIVRWNGTIDPHIWMDLSLWSLSIPHLVRALEKLKPAEGALFAERGEKMKRKMQKAHEEIERLMALIPEERRYLVTSHDAFNYFARAYLATEEERRLGNWEKRFAAPEGLAPDSQLSSANIREILEHLKRYDISVLFPESNLNRDSIRKVVSSGEDLGMNLRIAEEALYGDAMGPPGSPGESYLKMMQFNAETISKELMR